MLKSIEDTGDQTIPSGEDTEQAGEAPRSDSKAGTKKSGSPKRRSGWDDLTRGELKVVELVLEGLTNPQIGDRLEISRRTVSSHLSAVFRKLGIHSRIDLILQAKEFKRQGRQRAKGKA